MNASWIARMVPGLLLGLALAACGGAAAPSPDTILDSFRAAGLTVENVTTTDVLRPEVQSAASSCKAVRFEVGIEDNGGRVIACGSADDAAKVATYYRTLGEGNALFFSHIHESGALVLQMNGAIDTALFAHYVAALP